MDVSKLKPDMKVKNYKEMCILVGEKIKTGQSKVIQLKEWSRYFSFKKDNIKYIIVEIYEQPKEKISFRGTHNLSHTRIYKVWAGMRRRCFNKSCKEYVNYGGRGITVCDEWTDVDNGFINFYNWAISNGYKEDSGLSIDRIDVNGNYEPSNCAWVTQKMQVWNTRKTIHVPGKLQMTKAELIEYLQYLEEYLNDSDQTDIIEQYIY